MKRIAATLALTLAAVVAGAAPAFARDSYVVDNAGLFSASTVSALNQKIGDFNAQTHKEVFVDTEPTVVGGSAQAAAERIGAQQQVNGVLIYIAKSPKTVGVVPDRAAARFFPSGSTAAIRTAIVDGFNSGNFDGGITNGVDLTLNMYRSHIAPARTTYQQPAYAQPAAVTATRSDTEGGFHMGWIWWLIVLAVIFFIIRGIFRAMSGPRMMPPGYGGGPGPMGPMGGGYGPGYGPGYGGGYGGGGGGFFSGLLGGLGGAFLGNELFGNRGGETIIENPGQQAGFVDPGSSGVDQSGFQSDPGQMDMGNSSFGSWGGGDSGGGGGWGGGDSGGGGDWGGGGGDSGGGGW